MSILSLSADVPAHVKSWVRADDWNNLLAWPKTRAQKLMVAIICMENEHLEGVRRMLDQGLPGDVRVPTKMLIWSHIPSATISLLRVACELASPLALAKGSIEPLLSTLTQRGSRVSPKDMEVVLSSGDRAAATFLLSVDPSILRKLDASNGLARNIHAADMLQFVLDQDLPPNAMHKWLWSVEVNPETSPEISSMVGLLASRGFDLDVPTPYQPVQSRSTKSLLEYSLQSHLSMDEGTHALMSALIEHGARLENLEMDRLREVHPSLANLVDARIADNAACVLRDQTPAACGPVRSLRF